MARSAKSKQGSARKQTSSRRTSTRRRNGANGDAIALLKADHRDVEGWFEQFEKARSDDRKRELAQKICSALTAHTTIEEEIFYPAFLEATKETELHNEAKVEHEAAKNLIAEIEAASPKDEYYDAKVSVLSEMIKHHVKEEEQPGGMFAKARQSGMDLEAIGEKLQARKDELTDDSPLGRVAAALLGRRRAPQHEGRRGVR